MTALQQFDKAWLEWVQTNLDRGCDPSELCGIMRDNGFQEAAIEEVLGDAYPEEGTHLANVVPFNTEHRNAIAALNRAKRKLKKAEQHYQRAQAQYNEAKSKLRNIHSQCKEKDIAKVQQWYKTLAYPPLLTNPKPEWELEQIDTNGKLQLYKLKNFMSVEECERLIGLAEQHLKPSGVTHYNGDDHFRTSMTCDFVQVEHEMVEEIEDRISETLGIQRAYSETIQVQRYDIGQEFKAHYDYFTPNTEVYEKFAAEHGQRTWTFMVYLNDTPKGGGTRFTEIDQTFYPERGTAIIWNNLNEDGSTNHYTMHHGMPVEEGKKVIITKWFRDKGEGDLFHS